MAQGCILGRIDVTTANYKLEFIESGPITRDTQIAVGNYYPDSGTPAEDLMAVVSAAMDAAGNTYTISMLSDGRIRLECAFSFSLLTSTGYEDSLFLEMGFAATNPAAAYDGVKFWLEGTAPPKGTWFPVTRRDQDDRKWDTYEIVHTDGASQRGPTGAVVAITFGDWSTREITYSAIDASDAQGGLPRVRTCITEHWGHLKTVRVYADRVITGTNYFEAKWTEEQRQKGFNPTRLGVGFPYYEFTFEFIYA